LISFFCISALLAVSMNTLNMAPSWVLKALSNSILRWFGVCSYSIYIWQQVFYFLGRYARDYEYYRVLAVILTLLVASCSFYFFERPLRKWLVGRPLKLR
jgi:peptidoglycan/LPS O-acetylase OafA/YrhL